MKNISCLKRNKTLESDSMDHSKNFCHPAHDGEQQRYAAALQLQQSVATHRAAPAELQGRYIPIHLFVRRTAVYSIIIIYHVQAYFVVKPHTTMPHKKRWKKTVPPPKKKAVRESNPPFPTVHDIYQIYILHVRRYNSCR